MDILLQKNLIHLISIECIFQLWKKRTYRKSCIYIDTNKIEDIIRSKNRLDLEFIKYSIKEYIKRKDKDLVKLSLYAERLGIKEVIMDYVGMMYE